MANNLTCIICGEPLPNNKARAFCSKKCQTVFHNVKLAFKRMNGKGRPYERISTCAVCGKQYKSNRASHFCSEACKLEAEEIVKRHEKRTEELKNAQRVKMYTFTCPICKETFTSKNKKAVYCSTACRVQALGTVGAKNLRRLHSRYTVPKKRVICSVCGKEFLSGSAVAKYCSTECKMKHLEEIGRLMRKKCIVCGKEFLTASRRQKYCSNECHQFVIHKDDTKKERLSRKRKHRVNQSKLEQIRERLVAEALELHVSYGQLKLMYARKGIDPFEEIRRY